MTQPTTTSQSHQPPQETNGSLLIRTADGRVIPLAQFERETLERMETHRDELSEPGMPTAQLLQHLQRLEEIDQQERLTPERARELFRRMQAGETV